MSKGKLIVVEGADGSGKSTLVRNLAEGLTQQGQKVHLTREPGGTPHSERIREVFLRCDNSAEPRSPDSDLLLVYAARKQHLEILKSEYLDQGVNVICDRFSASTFAYQVYGCEASTELFFTLERSVVENTCAPDCYIYLDAQVGQCLKRMEQRNEGADVRFDREGEAFHQRIRDGYESFFFNGGVNQKLSRVVRLDGNESVDRVAFQALESIRSLLDD